MKTDKIIYGIISIAVIAVITYFIIPDFHFCCQKDWITVVLTLCNIVLFAVLTSEATKMTKQSAEKQMKQAKAIGKMQLSHSIFMKMYPKLNDSYMLLQESVQKDNQATFDTFKDTFNKSIKELSFIMPEILDLDSYKWWQEDFVKIDKDLGPNRDYDFNEHSPESSSKLRELLQDISKLIYS